MKRTPNEPQRVPYRVRLPGFIDDQEVGLGDVIRRATMSLGLKPCDNCDARAIALNRRIVFTSQRRQ
jgi:hypothetical protein